MTDTTTTPTVREAAEQVAAHLGEGWGFEPGTHDASAFITGPDGIRLHVWTNTYPLRGERAEITGEYPTPHDRRRYSMGRHVITVSLSKAPSRIAGDITRRLLPAYLPDLAQSIADEASHAAYVEASTSGADYLVSAHSGILDSAAWLSSETQRTFRVRSGEVYGDVKVSGSTTPVTLELRCLTLEQADRILAALEG